MEQAEIINAEFSTADAGYPSFSLNGERLFVQFEDWQEKNVALQFDDVCGVRWQELGPLSTLRDDVTYEIRNSEWIAAYRSQNLLPSEDKVRHFKLCFNSSGVLDVLASGFKRTA